MVGSTGPGSRGLLAEPLPPAFRRRTVILPPGTRHPYAPAVWHDALVVVAEGAVELEGRSGRRVRFDRGAVLTLSELPLRAVHCPGPEPAVLVVVARAQAR